jgi:outer membrane receptor protein involved in Fe transport
VRSFVSRSSVELVGLVLTAFAWPVFAVHAQTSPSSPSPQKVKADPAPQAPDQSGAATVKDEVPSAQVESVTVVAAPSDFRSSIDRRSYSLGKDVQSSTGSIADALRNVPSVAVDVQGNVSLRGDPNVVIMIDGKPSGMFRGEGRGQALQQLQATQFERVEVMTNPSAAFSPEGGAGIINLITKQNRGSGFTGSARANLGTGDRYNGGVSGSFNSKTLTISGDAGWRHDAISGSVADSREIRDSNGVAALRSSQQRTNFLSEGNSLNLRGDVAYDPNPDTRLGGELRYNRIDFDAPSDQVFVSRSGAATTLQAYSRLGDASLIQENTEGSINYRRKFSGDQHELTANASHERTDRTTSKTTTSAGLLLGEVPVFEDLLIASRVDESEAKIEYKRPLPDEVKLVVGYEARIRDNTYHNAVALGATPESAVIAPLLNSRFVLKRRIHSGYATYQRPMDRITILGGLRLEWVQSEMNASLAPARGEKSTVQAYPSLHVRYQLTDRQQFIGSYSRRVQRASPEDLNPNLVYQDPNNYKRGNSYLRDQEIDSMEFGYQYTKGRKYYLSTLYYRVVEDSFTDIVSGFGDGALVTTKANLGKSRSGGLELVASSPLSSKLSYSLSGNAFWNEISTDGLGSERTKSDISFQGGASLNWQATAKDFFQISGSVIGKRLMPQGYRKPTGLLNLGYRHKFNDKLTGVVTVQDALRTINDRFVIDTPAFSTHSTTKIDARAVFVGLTYSFGGADGRRPTPAFDFESGAGLGPSR